MIEPRTQVTRSASMSTVVREACPLGFVQVTSQVPTGTSTRLTLSSRTVVGVPSGSASVAAPRQVAVAWGHWSPNASILEEAGGAHDIELLEDGEQGVRQLVRILGTEEQALAVIGDAPEDVPLLALEGEAHHMGRHRRGPGVRRGGRGARVTATGLEAIGHEDHRIDDTWVGEPEVARRALEGEGERRPAGGPTASTWRSMAGLSTPSIDTSRSEEPQLTDLPAAVLSPR